MHAARRPIGHERNNVGRTKQALCAVGRGGFLHEWLYESVSHLGQVGYLAYNTLAHQPYYTSVGKKVTSSIGAICPLIASFFPLRAVVRRAAPVHSRRRTLPTQTHPSLPSFPHGLPTTLHTSRPPFSFLLIDSIS